MAIEHIEHDGTADTLWYRSVEDGAGRVIWSLRALLVIAILSSLWSVITWMDVVFNVEEITAAFRAALAGDVDPDLAPFRDMILLLDSVIRFIGAVLSIIFITLIVRYVMLYLAIKHGHPQTYGRIRFWASLMLATEVFTFFLWAYLVTEDFIVFEIGYSPNPVSLVAVALLVLLGRPSYKRFFSHYTVRRLDAPGGTWTGNIVAARAAATPSPHAAAPQVARDTWLPAGSGPGRLEPDVEPGQEVR